MIDKADFLPVSREEMHERGWWWYDFLVVGGDAYIDHPSFGTAIIARVLEHEGYRVAVLAQPATQQGGLARSPVQQGRAFFFMPHGGVFGRRFGWAGAQDDAVQNGPPDQAGNFDHAWIAEKFGEVAPQCGGGWCRRRAEIDQQHPDAAERHRRMVGGEPRGGGTGAGRGEHADVVSGGKVGRG